jgi:hypothetical protein
MIVQYLCIRRFLPNLFELYLCTSISFTISRSGIYDSTIFMYKTVST